MEPEHKPVILNLQIDASREIGPEELDRLTQQLRGEMRDLDVESVDLVKSGSRPEGTKSAEAVTVGALAVAVLPTVLPKVIEFLQAWLMRGDNRTVKIKTQIGDRSVEIEYSPRLMSQVELMNLVDTLTGRLQKKASK